jgi:CopG antitoxin of type II toxin-antitoxin system
MKLKIIPKFKNFEQEDMFWQINDAVEYFDLSQCYKVKLINLKPSQKEVE